MEKSAFESTLDQTTQCRHRKMRLASSRRTDKQQAGFGKVRVVAHIGTDRQRNTRKASAGNGIIGREDKAVDGRVLIQRRNVGALFEPPLAANARALTLLRPANSLALDYLPARASANRANFLQALRSVCIRVHPWLIIAR